MGCGYCSGSRGVVIIDGGCASCDTAVSRDRFGHAGGQWYSQGFGINNSGQVTGYSYISSVASGAFLYSNGAMHDLGTLGGIVSQGRGINNNGQVTGDSLIAGISHAFLYSMAPCRTLVRWGGGIV